MTHASESLLFGVAPTNLPTVSAIAAALLVVTLAASYLPARPAASTDTVVAQRSERVEPSPSDRHAGHHHGLGHLSPDDVGHGLPGAGQYGLSSTLVDR
ncbi:MAG: hypothetical protein HYY76_05355 [Acidobacteria bacterium]|nr:hypothetical protein [Acidobacteriota bacterium]